MIDHIAGSHRVIVPLSIAALTLSSLLLPGCGGPGTMLSKSPQLKQLEITPQASKIALGQTASFTATGIFSDGSSHDETKSALWSSSNGAIASIDSAGLATSRAIGSTKMVATANGLSGSATLTVSEAAIASIAVDPSASSIALGTTIQLKATGTYTDRSTRDVTGVVSWKSSEPEIATVKQGGLAASLTTGKASIVASSGAANASCELSVLAASLVSISISEDHSNIPLGTTSQLKAQGVYTDGSKRDLTGSVSWSSSPVGIVNVDSSGLATGKKIGAAKVDAKSGNITGSGAVTVSAPLLASIEVTSDSATMPLGTSQQMTATGLYTDGSMHDLTSSVSWSSTSGQIVSVSGSGEAGARSQGTSVVSATSERISGSKLLTVSPAALTTIEVSPANPTVPLTSSLQLTATGTFTDGSTQNLTSSVTWSVDHVSVVAINNAGTAIAEQVGSTGVEAVFSDIQGSTTVVVEPIAATSYFATGPNVQDTTVRITNPGSTEPYLCAMLYVFDQDQQMAECCGCQIARDGLRTLSLNTDLIANPLTGRTPVSGTVLLVTADYVGNTTCNPSSIIPDGMAIAWQTHLQSTAPQPSATTEESLSQTPLNATLSSALQAQCTFIEQLGGGRGRCSCGTGH